MVRSTKDKYRMRWRQVTKVPVLFGEDKDDLELSMLQLLQGQPQKK